jgi:hypothetical protein
MTGRPRPPVPAATRPPLARRSGGWCEAQLSGYLGWASDLHHRITRKAGGRRGAARERHDRLSNLLHLRGVCHQWVGARVAEACGVGLSLKEWQTPAQEPVQYRGAMVYLDDAGTVRRFEVVDAWS